LADCERALKADPSDAYVLVARAESLWKLGRCEEALGDLSTALQSEPDNDRALMHRINFFTDLGRYEEAIADIEVAMKVVPSEHEQLLIARGLRLSYLERYQDACNDFEQVGLAQLGVAYYHAVAKAKLAGAEAARQEIQTVRDRMLSFLGTENRGRALLYLGGLCAVENDFERALKYLAEAKETGDSIDFALRDVAWLGLRPQPEFQALLKP